MKRTVISVLLALCISLVQMTHAGPSPRDMKEIVLESKCLENGDLTIEEVKEYTMDGNLELAETKPELKCFTACVLEHLGVMDNCKITEDNIADAQLLKEIGASLPRCKAAEEAGERCQCASELMKCLIEDVASREADN